MKIVKLSAKNINEITFLDEIAFGMASDKQIITEKKILEILASGFILGIRKNNKLISNLHVLEEKDKWFIDTIATHPKEQGLGLANKLLQKVLEMAKEKKIQQIQAVVRPENQKSLKLFEKNGFKRVKLIRDYHGKGKDRILFEYLIQK